MAMRRLKVAVVAVVSLCAPALGRAAPEPAAPLRCVVSIAPLAGLVAPLIEAASPGARVEVLIPAGVSEHGYEPTPAQVAALARADLVVLVGLGLERAIERAARERPDFVGRAAVFAEVAGIAPTNPPHGPAAGHDHEAGDCDHGSTDPHLWLDPALAMKLVSHVYDMLLARLAEPHGSPCRAALRVAADQLVAELQTLDAQYAAALAPHAGKPVVVAHDAWGFLARRYALEFVPISGLSAGEPTPGALANAVDVVKRRGLTSVYVQPQLSPAAVRRIAAATGTTVRTLDPLGTGDYFAFMRANLDALVAGFEPRGAPASDAKDATR